MALENMFFLPKGCSELCLTILRNRISINAKGRDDNVAIVTGREKLRNNDGFFSKLFGGGNNNAS
jgi:hypothetical protein